MTLRARWLRILLVSLALLLAAGWVLPHFLDADRYRPRIISAVEEQTGRTASIGKIRARLLPRVGFVVEDFRLGNPPDFGGGDVLSVDIIHGNLALADLLRRELRLTSVELLRPKLALLEDDRGQTNYSFEKHPAPSKAKARAPSPPAPEVPGQVGRLSEIEHVTLTNAEVSVARVVGHNRSVAPSLRLRNISVELDHVALDSARLKQWQGDARLDGTRLELPGLAEPVVFGSGRLKLREGRIEAEFRAGLKKMDEVKGRLHVADFEQAVPVFDLSTPQLDLDALLELMRGPSAAPQPSETPAPRSKELVAKGHLTAGRIKWSPYAAENASAEIRVFADRVELWPVKTELYGGSLQISARSDRTQVPSRFSVNIQLRNLDVGRMLAASSARGKLAGRGEFDLQLFGALSSHLERSLTGSGSFAVREGRLPGVNLAGAGESLAMLSGLSSDTPFHVLRGDLSISQGRVSSRQIHLDSPRGTVDLTGSFGLDGSLDYEGRAVLLPGAASPDGAQNPLGAIAAGVLGGALRRNVERVTVPISIRGTLREPKVLPGRGVPTFTRPAQTSPPGQTAPQQSPWKKNLEDLFRRP